MNPYPRPITVPECKGLIVHYSIPNVYGIRFFNLYDEEEADNWLITELNEGRYKLYKLPESNLFQAIKQTPNASEREIIELIQEAEIDRPLAEGQHTIADGAWTVDEYPGVAEMIRWDAMPPARLLQPSSWSNHTAIPSARLSLPTTNLPVWQGSTDGVSSLLAAALLLDRPTPGHWDLGDDTNEPITTPVQWQPRTPFLLPYNCSPQTRSLLLPPQKRIADLVIADAIAKGESCSIAMTPLTQESAVCVGPCYHAFSTEAITTWLTNNTTCPTCRAPCTL